MGACVCACVGMRVSRSARAPRQRSVVRQETTSVWVCECVRACVDVVWVWVRGWLWERVPVFVCAFVCVCDCGCACVSRSVPPPHPLPAVVCRCTCVCLCVRARDCRCARVGERVCVRRSAGNGVRGYVGCSLVPAWVFQRDGWGCTSEERVTHLLPPFTLTLTLSLPFLCFAAILGHFQTTLLSVNPPDP